MPFNIFRRFCTAQTSEHVGKFVDETKLHLDIPIQRRDLGIEQAVRRAADVANAAERGFGCGRDNLIRPPVRCRAAKARTLQFVYRFKDLAISGRLEEATTC
jgi:hypothetical protein